MNRITYIRDAEKEYHDYCYDNYKLFEKGSWLYRPVKTVMEHLKLFDDMQNLRVLDLGAGVGRNSIPIAQNLENGEVVYVDFLDSAIERLNQYSKEFRVENTIKTIKSDIGDYPIKEESFDYIFAVSSLEHLASEEVFENVLKQMATGTKMNGINCIIVNSNLQEILIETNEKLEALMEINLTTDDMLSRLKQVYYKDWDVLNQLIKPLEYQIVRDGKPVLLKTNAITYVIKKRA
jgi:SAM-dependent methyltransferase